MGYEVYDIKTLGRANLSRVKFFFGFVLVHPLTNRLNVNDL